MKTTFLIAALLAFTVLVPAFGEDTANAVFLGGTPIMRVRVAAGGYTAEERATHIQARVNKLLGQGPITPSDITVRNTGNEAEVDVKGQLHFTADWATARFNQATPIELAQTWANNMRTVLPSLTQPK